MAWVIKKRFRYTLEHSNICRLIKSEKEDTTSEEVSGNITRVERVLKNSDHESLLRTIIPNESVERRELA